MTQVDLLLYRPWSNDSRRKENEQPVDFSKTASGNERSDMSDESFTEIDVVSKSEAEDFHEENQHSGKSSDSESTDSGISSPSEAPIAPIPSYPTWFPSFYQQALANHHAIQREVFYRDALQREIFQRQTQNKENLIHNEQVSPLSLVVKRKYSSEMSSDIEEERRSKRMALDSSISDGGKNVMDYVNDKADVDGDSLTDKKFVPPPQTSPYHMLPPSLYWPHGATPVGDQIDTKPFIADNAYNHPRPVLPSHPHQLLNAPNALTYPPLSSPIGLHLPNAFNNPLSSPLTSPVARAAYDLTVTINENNNNVVTQPTSCGLSPRLNTPSKSPSKVRGNSISSKHKFPNSPDKKGKSPKKNKATRRLNFDEDKTSPVSGTIIRELADGEEPLVVRKGDIDPAYNVVEITEEAKAEISKIENKIGEYVCRLCKELYDDAFGLAQHRCSRIIHVEYRCPECEKVFNCPANLASHRRWHKPKGSNTKNSENKISSALSDPRPSTSKDNQTFIAENVHQDKITNEDKDSGETYECTICFKSFKRQAYLRKHISTHRRETEDQQTPSVSSQSIIQPVPHKTLPQMIGIPPSRFPHNHLLPPLTPPMLSPPFSPPEIIKCPICQSSFFSSAALTIHFATAHRRDPGMGSAFTSTTRDFMDLALEKISSSAGGFPVPQPQYLQGNSHTSSSNPLTSHLLHRPSQISATS